MTNSMPFGLSPSTSCPVVGRKPGSQLPRNAPPPSRFPLTSCSLKIGEGLPEDDPDDLVDPVYSKIWAGTVPIRESFGEPITDDHTPAGVPVPHYIANWTRP